MTLFLAGHLGMKNRLSLQVCSGPDPNFGSLQLPLLYLVT